MANDMLSSQGDRPSFEIPPQPIPDSDISSTITAELVVVGEGLAGLCTALSAAQSGVDTVIVTGSVKPVGRGGSVFAAYSKVMERLGYPRQEVENFYLEEFAASSFCVDQRKWYGFYNNSEEAMNWLVDMLEEDGCQVVLEDVNTDEPHSPTNQPVGTHTFAGEGISFGGLGITLALKALEKRFLAAGGRVFHSTVAKQLVRPEGGRVEAVIAQDSEGKYIRFNAGRAVVLATGDFSADKEMMDKYCPVYSRYFTAKDVDYDRGFAINGLFRGDGQKMALWAGAAWQRTFPNAAMIQGSRTAANMPYGSHRGLRLNRNGERFMNEDSNGAYSALSVLREPGETAYAIWGTNYAYDIPWRLKGSHCGDENTSPETVIARWESGVKSGSTVKADTLEEVVDKLGLPHDTAMAEIARYNQFCRDGYDADFHKKSKYLQELRQPPFYGAPINDIFFFTVMGGPRTDYKMRVCDADDNPIPGLFAVGSIAGDMFANCYNFRIAGHNYGCCLTFGYLTGKYIAENH